MRPMLKVLFSASILVICIDLLSVWFDLMPSLPTAMPGALFLMCLLELAWFGSINALDYVSLGCAMALAHATLANSMEKILLSTTWISICLY